MNPVINEKMFMIFSIQKANLLRALAHGDFTE